MKLKFTILIISLCVCGLIFGQASEEDNIPVDIMGAGILTESELISFFESKNPTGDIALAKIIVPIYIMETEREGVNHDIAFAQMILETGYLNYGGTVDKCQRNFCGLGATSRENKGWSFDNDTLGIIAHVQHLKAYGSSEPLNCELVDPRYNLVSPKGKSPTIYGLTGTWATDPQYSTKIYKILVEMYEYRTKCDVVADI